MVPRSLLLKDNTGGSIKTDVEAFLRDIISTRECGVIIGNNPILVEMSVKRFSILNRVKLIELDLCSLSRREIIDIVSLTKSTSSDGENTVVLLRNGEYASFDVMEFLESWVERGEDAVGNERNDKYLKTAEKDGNVSEAGFLFIVAIIEKTKNQDEVFERAV